MSEIKRATKDTAEPTLEAATPVCVLDLRSIEACSTLTANVLGTLHEAAAVVLDKLHPSEGCSADGVVCHNDVPRPAVLRWRGSDERSRASHANETDASTAAAYAVAIVAAFRLLDFRVVARAKNRSGADYLMRRDGDPADALVRLEVSGVTGVASAASRLRTKVEQLERGNDPRRGVAVVVEFSATPVRVLSKDVG